MARYKTILALTVAAISLHTYAQFDQTILVEGKYIPEVINRERVGTFPQPIYFPLEAASLQYNLASVNADFAPTAIPIPASTWRAARDPYNQKGYLDFGVGSWLNSTLSAGIRLVHTPYSNFGIDFQHNSTSLWKPGFPYSLANTRRYRYDERIGIYGDHLFSGYGRLSLFARYHFGAFNYYGYNPDERLFEYEMEGLKAPGQSLNDIEGRIKWASLPEWGNKVNYSVALGARYFGYRRLYIPSDFGDRGARTAGVETLTGGRETHIDLDGNLNWQYRDNNTLGVNLNADILSYSKHKNLTDPEATFDAPDSYGFVGITPHWQFQRGRFGIRLGLKADLTFNAGPASYRYDTFHIAPDCRVDYNAGPAALYLILTGGTELHTLASGYNLDYYQMPAIYNSTPTHTPIDAKLGVATGPFAGFSAGIEFGVRATRSQYFGGLYQAWLNYAEMPLPGLPSAIDSFQHLQYSYVESASNLTGWMAVLRLGYDGGKIIKIKASGSYQPQKAEHGYFNGYDRPRWLLAASAESNPWSSLKLRLQYDYRGVRAQPVWAYPISSNPMQAMLDAEVKMVRLPDLCMLGFGASYDITPRMNVWLQADNLLGNHTPRFICTEEEGLRLSAGFGIIF